MANDRYNVRLDGSLVSRLLLDLIAVIGGGITAQIEGIDADDAPATANPVLIGGKFIADPTADTLDDGDAGYALLNEQRMLIVQSRAYDSPTDADKVFPVWSPPDLYAAEDLSGSLGALGTVTYYISMDSFLRWSLQFVPVAGPNYDLEVFQSNEDVADPSTATYTDVTNIFFGVASFTTEYWIEPELPTSCKWLRVDVSADAAGSWELQARKLAQS